MSAHRGSRLAFYLAAGYSILIAFASLYPFSGWTQPETAVYSFLDAPFPRHPLRSDILINFLGYLPLGFFVSFSLLSRKGFFAAVGAALFSCLLLSFGMESLQVFLPARVASTLDILTNSAGGLCGGLLAVRASRFKRIFTALTRMRDRWIVPGAVGDLGLALIALWFFTQLNPSLPLMGSWIVDEGQPLQRLFSPHRFSLVEACAVSLNLLSLGLVTSFFAKSRSRLSPIALILFMAALVKIVSATLMLQESVFFIWAREEAILGIASGLALLHFSLRLPAKYRVALAAAAIFLDQATVFLTPDVASPVSEFFMFSLRFGQLLNLGGATFFFSRLWPLLALCYLAAAYFAQAKKCTPSSD